MAEKAGIAVNSFRLYEAGKRQPKYETLQKIANALNVSIYNFIDSGFGALDAVLPPNMQGANLDGAKIDVAFLNFLLSNLSFLDRKSSEYYRSRENIIALASSSNLLEYAEAVLHQMESDNFLGLTFLSLDETKELRLQLLKLFDDLNELGQKKAIENIKDLTKIPDYRNSISTK